MSKGKCIFKVSGTICYFFQNSYEECKYFHTKSKTWLDISNRGGLGVSSSTDRSMKIWQASNGELRVKALDTLLGWSEKP